jgi:topoisomerase-4 subunit A
MSNKVYSAVYYDGGQKSYYLKRFVFESVQSLTNFTAEEDGSKLISLSVHQHPRFEIKFGGAHKTRPAEIISAEEFIAVKGVKAKGKRMTTFVVASVTELEPLIPDDEFGDIPEVDPDETDPDNPDDPPQMALDI